MRLHTYNNFIRGYIYSINECAAGNIEKLKCMYLYTENNDEFEDGVFKGIFESEHHKFIPFTHRLIE